MSDVKRDRDIESGPEKRGRGVYSEREREKKEESEMVWFAHDKTMGRWDDEWDTEREREREESKAISRKSPSGM